MQSPASTLAAALRGRECHVERREADWSFDFGERLNIAASVPWRVVTKDGIAHADEDDGQWFGLSKPVDGEARANELLHGQKIVGGSLIATPLTCGLCSTVRASTSSTTHLATRVGTRPCQRAARS